MDGLDRSFGFLECLWNAHDIIVHTYVCMLLHRFWTHIQMIQSRNVSQRVNLQIPQSLSWTMPMMGLFEII